MAEEIVNNLKALLFGGEGAPDYAPDGMLEKRGLSAETFARAAGLTRASIYLYTSKKSRPTTETLRRMCEVLGISFAEGTKYVTPSKIGAPTKKK